MLRDLFSFALFPLLGAVLYQCSAQIPSPRTNAPFTAMRVQITTKLTQSHTTSGVVARRSDGSSYVELRNSDGTGAALIHDVVHHQIIELYLDHHLFAIYPQPNLKAQVWPEGYAAKYLKSAGAPGSKRILDGGYEITTIGPRTIENIETVGFDERTADGRAVERWYSPSLDLDIEKKFHAPALGADSETHIQQIHLGEPDGSLFEIPAGYGEDKSHTNKACLSTAGC